jgi:hypothetical protein
MDFYNIALEAEIRRREIDERIARAQAPRIPATAHRHLLAQRLHRLANRIDN